MLYEEIIAKAMIWKTSADVFSKIDFTGLLLSSADHLVYSI